jgi:hypothetical protein
LDVGDALGLSQYAASGNDVMYGSSFADTIVGWSGSDIIYGYSGNDALYGADGNDTLIGGTGDDYLIGGSGLNFASFSGSFNQYEGGLNQSGWLEVIDTVTNRDGTDYLTEVQRLQFTDVTLALDIDGIAGQAYRLYKAAFDRTPDLGGLGFWITALDNGASITTAANGFVDSQEFVSKYGANTSDADFIRLLYENVLDRQPDEGGYAFWLNAMQSGLTRAQVLVEFSDSPENIANVAPLVDRGIEYIPFIT